MERPEAGEAWCCQVLTTLSESGKAGKREFSVISGDEEQVKAEQLASQELMLTLKEQGSESWGNGLRWNNGEMQNFRDKFPP